MKNIGMLIPVFAILLSCTLVGCEGTTEENSQNEMQQQNTEPNAREEAESRGINPSTSVDPKTEGEGMPETSASIGGTEMMPSRSIVENLTANPKLSTMASAIRQANIVKDLSSTGPYTVFAPSNDAFKALPDGTLEDLMKPENRQHLQTLLNSHVVPGKVTEVQLQDGSSLKTVGGAELKITKQGNSIRVNSAQVTEGDAMSQNGVIHVIDKVMMAQDGKAAE